MQTYRPLIMTRTVRLQGWIGVFSLRGWCLLFCPGMLGLYFVRTMSAKGFALVECTGESIMAWMSWTLTYCSILYPAIAVILVGNEPHGNCLTVVWNVWFFYHWQPLRGDRLFIACSASAFIPPRIRCFKNDVNIGGGNRPVRIFG